MRLTVRKRLGSRDLAGPDMHRPIPSKPKTPAPDCPGGEVDPISGNMIPGTSMIATPDVDGASFGMDSRSGIVHLHVETPGSVLHWHSPEERAMSQNARSRRACDCQERGNRRGIERRSPDHTRQLSLQPAPSSLPKNSRSRRIGASKRQGILPNAAKLPLGYARQLKRLRPR